MVKLNKIYTRTGDDGTTGLVSGPRRLKHDLRVEAYGTIDETNSAIGVARLHVRPETILDGMLTAIQNDLFDLGADLSTPETDEPPAFEPLRIIDAQVDRLEKDIDRLNAELSPLNSFVLPAGSCRCRASASCAHDRAARRAADGGACPYRRRKGQRRRRSNLSTGCPISCLSRRAMPTTMAERRALGAGQKPLTRRNG